MESKIPFYNMVNMFLLGLVFSVFTLIAYPEQTKYVVANYSDIERTFPILLLIIVVGLMYEIGIIINRISSTIVEELLIIVKIIPCKKTEYKNFNNCRKENPFLYTLSREYALSRGNITLWILLSIIFFTTLNWLLFWCSLLICAIFLLSTIKFSKKINYLVADYMRNTKK